MYLEVHLDSVLQHVLVVVALKVQLRPGVQVLASQLFKLGGSSAETDVVVAAAVAGRGRADA